MDSRTVPHTENQYATTQPRRYRILLVVRWPVGGIRTFLRYVYRNFDAERYQFTVLAPDLPETRILLEEDLAGFAPDYRPLPPRLSRWQFFRIVSTLVRKEKFDLIHSHGFTAAMVVAGGALMTGTPHLLTAHDVLLPGQFVGGGGLMKRMALSVTFPLLDAIHAVSGDVKNNLLEFLWASRHLDQKIRVIPNGIEVERFADCRPKDLRAALGLPAETFLIGFLGRFMAQKGFTYLIEALAKLLEEPDLERSPVLLTFGAGGFIREEQEAVRRLGLEKRVHFMPFEPNVGPALKGLDVLAMPSLWEACGLVAIEAMVAGVPVIGTDCIGLREVLRGSPNVMVPARDSAALARALLEELQAPSKARAQAYRAEAVRRFDVRKQSADLETVMMQLLAGKVSAPRRS